jgi:hypothetical protein
MVVTSDPADPLAFVVLVGEPAEPVEPALPLPDGGAAVSDEHAPQNIAPIAAPPHRAQRAFSREAKESRMPKPPVNVEMKTIADCYGHRQPRCASIRLWSRDLSTVRLVSVPPYFHESKTTSMAATAVVRLSRSVVRSRTAADDVDDVQRPRGR